METSYIFRENTKKEDIAIIKRLAISAGNFTEGEIEIAEELIIERISKGEKSGYEFIFCEDSQKRVLGYLCYGEISCTIGSYDIYWIIVDKNFQGKGVGTMLLKQAEEKIFSQKGRNIYIETSSKVDYTATQKFYLKNDYQEIARLKDFYAESDDKIIYQKKAP